ncbi:MAG: hypothetical protein ACI3W9_03585 [Eubacteriales bacterium]
MKKTMLVIFAAVLLLSSCTGGGSVSGSGSEANGVNGEAGGDDSVKWLGYGYPPYWEPDETVAGRFSDAALGTEPMFCIVLTEQPKSGDDSVKTYLMEIHGKNFVSFSNLYVLERKTRSGEWEIVPFGEDYVVYEDSFVGSHDGYGAAAMRLNLKARDHGLEGFEAGIYRVTLRASCMVNDEQRGCEASLIFVVE